MEPNSIAHSSQIGALFSNYYFHIHISGTYACDTWMFYEIMLTDLWE